MVEVEYWGNTSNWHKPIYLIEGSFWCLFTLRTLLFLLLFINESNIEHLTETERNQCEGMVTYTELGQVLKDMKNGKTPGTDGFTVEFYKFFGGDIGQILLESLNEALQKKELSITQKQGIITLIPKNNKPRELIQNWRPITLLNVDYKLLSGVFANRIKKVLPKLMVMIKRDLLRTGTLEKISEQSLMG